VWAKANGNVCVERGFTRLNPLQASAGGWMDDKEDYGYTARGRALGQETEARAGYMWGIERYSARGARVWGIAGCVQGMLDGGEWSE
jgi:hypothetical protein